MDSFRSSLWPTRPSSAAALRLRARLVNAPTTPPPADILQARIARSASRSAALDRENYRRRLAERCTEPGPKLGDLLVLFSRLLDAREVRAVSMLIEELARSDLADVQLPRTQSLFKHQLEHFCTRHQFAFSKDASDLIQRCGSDEARCGGDEAQNGSEAEVAATMRVSVASTRNASESAVPAATVASDASTLSAPGAAVPAATAASEAATDTSTATALEPAAPITNRLTRAFRHARRRLSRSGTRRTTFSPLQPTPEDEAAAPHGPSPRACGDLTSDSEPSSSSRAASQREVGEASCGDREVLRQHHGRVLPGEGSSRCSEDRGGQTSSSACSRAASYQTGGEASNCDHAARSVTK